MTVMMVATATHRRSCAAVLSSIAAYLLLIGCIAVVAEELTICTAGDSAEENSAAEECIVAMDVPDEDGTLMSSLSSLSSENASATSASSTTTAPRRTAGSTAVDDGDDDGTFTSSLSSSSTENAHATASTPRQTARSSSSIGIGIRTTLVSSNDPTCIDEDVDDCLGRALLGQCSKRPEDTLHKCPASCKLCNNHLQDQRMVETCYGDDQEAGEPETLQVIQKMQEYMRNKVYAVQDDKYQKVRAQCKNRNKKCSYWASLGECEANAAYMQRNCAPACQSCEMLDYNHRCPFDKVAAQEHTLWSEPGELDDFFWGLVRNDTLRERYNLAVLSGPVNALEQMASLNQNTKELRRLQNDEEKMEDSAWVIQLDNLLSSAECDRLIELGHDIGYVRSKDLGKKKFDGSFDSYTSDERTSTTAWCGRDTACVSDPVTVAVTARIEELTGISAQHSEAIQLLRYQLGQRYGVHHDYTAHLVDRPPGVRILTVFLYLNHDGLQGGGTNFPQLPGNLTVQPRKGRAVLWPSVLNDQPGLKDPRTSHQALPVEEGVKFGANFWIHERDFQTPHQEGCAS